MNPGWTFRFKVFFLFSGYFFLIGNTFSGVLLTKNGQVEIGTLMESGNTVTLQSPKGTIPYPKETLLWYSIEREIDTYLEAAQKARAEGNTRVAVVLFEASVEKESSTQFQARAELDTLKKTILPQPQENTPTEALLDQQATQETLDEFKEALGVIEWTNQWTFKEILGYGITTLLAGLFILWSIWRIAAKEIEDY